MYKKATVVNVPAEVNANKEQLELLEDNIGSIEEKMVPVDNEASLRMRLLRMTKVRRLIKLMILTRTQITYNEMREGEGNVDFVHKR